MTDQKQHIISKVFLEVNTASEEKATQIKNNVSGFLQNDVFPALEKLIDNWDDDQIIRFDKINVDVNVKEWSNSDAIKRELVNKVMLKIDDAKVASIKQNVKKENLKYLSGDFKKPKNYLSSKTENFSKELDVESHQTFGGHKTIGQQQNYQTTMLHFLEYGFLPWFGKQEYIEEFILPKQWLQNLKQHNFLTRLKELFRENKTAIERFVFQFSDEQVLAFIDVNETIQISNKPVLLDYLKTLSAEFRNSFLEQLIKIATNSNYKRHEYIELVKQQVNKEDLLEMGEHEPVNWKNDFLSAVLYCFEAETYSKYFRLSDKEVQQIIKEIKSVVTGTQVGDRAEGGESKKTNLENKPTIVSQEFVNSVIEKEPPFFEKNKNEIVVQNAGLVLFHPFLSTFFKSFNWLDENGRIIHKKRFHAIQSLHFLATGSEDFFEGKLIIEKFLCGVPLNSPIPKKSMLSVEVKNETDNLLKEFIRHWPALKNTQADGLRQMFVHRDGKLIQKDKSWKLIVERKVQDILLEKLQWNISIVKLPWKDDLLFVEW